MGINMASTPKKDDRTKAIESNPCPTCRLKGFPSCTGHGGGGGSSGDSKDASDRLEDASTKTTATATPTFRPILLETQLMQSQIWKCKDEFTFTFESQDALFTMEIDMVHNRIIFLGDKNLSREQREDLRLFFDTIMKEFNEFKRELTAQGISVDNITVTREGNTLILSFGSSNRIQYDAFVQRLIDKNLIPMHPRPAPQEKHENHLVEEQGRRSNTPTPFDIYGPKR
jgi:hypothetical protein